MKTVITKNNSIKFVPREKWLDTIKVFLIVRIFSTHFRFSFPKGRYDYGIIMKLLTANGGISGKFCVQMFAVILGYFATLAGERKQEKYITKRYLYFFSCILLINCIYYLFAQLGFIKANITINSVIFSAFSLGGGVYSAAWFFIHFFLGSIICYLNGRGRINFLECILEIIVFILYGNVWVAACIMGSCLVYITKEEPIINGINKWYLQLTLIVICWFVLPRKESATAYIIDGIVSFILLVICFSSSIIKRVLSINWLSRLGQYSMEIFLIHTLVYSTLGRKAFNYISRYESLKLSWVLTWLICLLCIIVLSFPIKIIIKNIIKMINKMSNFILQFYRKILMNS